MDSGINKKVMAAGVAALAAFVFGESQIMDMDERLRALEEHHPELKQEELDEIAEDLQSEEESVEESVEEPADEGVSEEE